MQAIRLLVLDVDGVMTDGSITIDSAGGETKTFCARDGQAIKLWQEAGLVAAILTSRQSEVVRRRAAELGIRHVVQGVEDKGAALERLCAELGVPLEEVCYMGDDLPDWPLVRRVGLGVAVADACPELKAAADYVTSRPGGRGAVREVVEMILKAKDRWETVLRRYVPAGPLRPAGQKRPDLPPAAGGASC